MLLILISFDLSHPLSLALARSFWWLRRCGEVQVQAHGGVGVVEKEKKSSSSVLVRVSFCPGTATQRDNMKLVRYDRARELGWLSWREEERVASESIETTANR